MKANDPGLSAPAKDVLEDMAVMERAGWNLAGDDIAGWRWSKPTPFRGFYGKGWLPELIEAGLVEEWATSCYRLTSLGYATLEIEDESG